MHQDEDREISPNEDRPHKRRGRARGDSSRRTGRRRSRSGQADVSKEELDAVPVEVPFFQVNNGECPYLPDRTWENVVTVSERMDGSTYEFFLNRGFRRMGCFIYHPVCKGCQLCIPIRVDVERFRPDKGQRRTWRRNQDLEIERRPLSEDYKAFDLYERYQMDWHGDDEVSFKNYRLSFLRSPVRAEMVYYRLGEDLVAVGFIDVLPTLVSSVYFVFDPELKERRLGVFSILWEIELCRELGLPWLYLGYWVPGAGKMEYKAEYDPSEIYYEGRWQPLEAFER